MVTYRHSKVGFFSNEFFSLCLLRWCVCDMCVCRSFGPWQIVRSCARATFSGFQCNLMFCSGWSAFEFVQLVSERPYFFHHWQHPCPVTFGPEDQWDLSDGGPPCCQRACQPAPRWLEAGIMWEVQLETEIALSQALAACLLTCTSALTFQSSSHLFPPP